MTASAARPGDRVRATAPVRVADVGGWTDTWFGSPGRVCHLAVGPGVTVEARMTADAVGSVGDPAAPWLPVRLVAPQLGEDYRTGPSPHAGWRDPRPARQPLVEHAVAEVLERRELAPGLGVDVTITSEVPPGASLGTSASVVVALLGALEALLGGEAPPPDEVAARAHLVETGRAGREAGVQDQWAAAFGGAGKLAVAPYPEVRHSVVDVPPGALEEIRLRTVTVVFGAHDSSAVHHEVINAMTGCGGEDHDRARTALRRLAALAGSAADALRAGDVDGWSEVLVASTEAQEALHRGLVGPAHHRAIGIGRSAGAVGWKVNGAGGDGGSLTLVARDPRSADELAASLRVAERGWRVLRLSPSPGLTITR